MPKKLAKIGDVYETTIEGTTFHVTKAEVPRYPWGQARDGSPGHPMYATWHEVRIGGDLVGFIFRPSGVGQPVSARNLLPEYEMGLPHPNLGDVGLRTIEDTRKVDDIDFMLQRFVRYRSEGKLPTADEIVRLRAAYVVTREEERIRRVEESARRDRERAEREEADRRFRAETVEALEGIRERLSGQLTNFEVEAIARAISRF